MAGPTGGQGSGIASNLGNLKGIVVLLVGLGLGATGFWAGRASVGQASAGGRFVRAGSHMPVQRFVPAHLVPTRLVAVQNVGPPADPRELVPLPGPPGQLPGPGTPPQQGEQGQQEMGQCPLYLYQDGQLYQFESPGRPGEAPPGGGDSQELFPLEPSPGPQAPRTPPRPDPRERRPGGLTVEAVHNDVPF